MTLSFCTTLGAGFIFMTTPADWPMARDIVALGGVAKQAVAIDADDIVKYNDKI